MARARRGFVAALVGSAVALGAVTPAAADGAPAAARATTHPAAVEALLATFVDALRAAAGDDDGFADIRVDVGTGTVTLLHDGRPPAGVADVARQVEEDGVKFEHEDVRLSATELAVQAESLATELDRMGVRWTAIGGDGDYDAVEVSGPAVSREGYVQEAVRARADRRLPGTPVRFVADAAATPTASRDRDASPFSGGARIRSSGQVCTAGFGMTNTVTGKDYLLTAAHCADWTDGRNFTDSRAWIIGTNSYTRVLSATHRLDATVVALDKKSRAAVWIKAWDSEQRAGIYGSRVLAQGEKACVSGASLGQVCSLTRAKEPHTLRKVDGHTVWTMKLTKGGKATSMPGDSGGPVFWKHPTSGKRYAVGIITAGGGTATCPADTDRVTRTCDSHVIVTPLERVLDVLDDYGRNSVVLKKK